jgi:TctA family transporter
MVKALMVAVVGVFLGTVGLDNMTAALGAAIGQDTLEVKHFSNEEGKGWQKHIL